MTTANPTVETTTEAAPEAAAPAESKKTRVRMIAIGAIALGCLGILGWYAMHAGLEGTDDAQVEADVAPVPARIAGSVVKVSFEDNQLVKAGDVLVEIDPAPAQAHLAEAEAKLTADKAAADAADAEVAIIEATAKGQKSLAEASVAGARVGETATADEIAQAAAQVTAAAAARQQAFSDLNRVKSLVDQKALPKQQLDSAQNTFDAAEANLQQAKAHQAYVQASRAQAHSRVDEARARLGQSSTVDSQIANVRAAAAAAHARAATSQAQRDLAALDASYTKIVAPRDGLASKKSVVVGQMLQVGQPVAQIVPRDVWVIANFKETQIDKMKPGAPAEVEVDAYPSLKLHGTVQSFSGATGSRFSLLPPENATGNFTKVVQRVPVKIKLDDVPQDKPLRPGMSADVTVDTRK